MDAEMKLHGSIEENLTAAIRSARRLRDHPVHADTLSYWNELLHHARREFASGSDDAPIRQLVVDLETEIAARSS